MSAARRSVSLVVNPGSRRGADLLEGVEARFAAAGLDLLAVHRLDGDLGAALDAAIADGADVVAVAGGDGTISSAVGRFAHRDLVLGVLPAGTTNNFARTLGVPSDLDGALRLLATGVVTDIDLGVAGDEHFANVANLGISVDVAHRVPAGLKRVIGRAAYAVTGAGALLRHRAIRMTIESDTGTHVFRTHQLVVANGRFHGGMLIASDADPDDDRLIVFHLGDDRRIQLLRSLLLLAFGRPRTLQEGNFVEVRQGRITADPPQDLELDGEVRARTPVDVRIDLEALKVVVPRPFPGDGPRDARQEERTP